LGLIPGLIQIGPTWDPFPIPQVHIMPTFAADPTMNLTRANEKV